jgi:hypothetical protein
MRDKRGGVARSYSSDLIVQIFAFQFYTVCLIYLFLIHFYLPSTKPLIDTPERCIRKIFLYEFIDALIGIRRIIYGEREQWKDIRYKIKDIR